MVLVLDSFVHSLEDHKPGHWRSCLLSHFPWSQLISVMDFAKNSIFTLYWQSYLPPHMVGWTLLLVWWQLILPTVSPVISTSPWLADSSCQSWNLEFHINNCPWLPSLIAQLCCWLMIWSCWLIFYIGTLAKTFNPMLMILSIWSRPHVCTNFPCLPPPARRFQEIMLHSGLLWDQETDTTE